MVIENLQKKFQSRSSQRVFVLRNALDCSLAFFYIFFLVFWLANEIQFNVDLHAGKGVASNVFFPLSLSFCALLNANA